MPNARRPMNPARFRSLRLPSGLLLAAPTQWGLKVGAAALLFIGAALTTLRPIADGRIHFATIDNFLFLYTLEWERTSLLKEPHRFFEGLGFFGMGDSLFYTHLLLGGLPIYAAVATFFGPIAGLNFLVIASPVLNATAAAIAAWILLRRWWPAILAGFVFGFAPVQQDFSGFLHMQLFWWTPLAAAFWFWFLRRPTWWKLSGAWLCVFVQFATGIYLGFISLVTLLALMAAALFFRGSPSLDRRLLAKSVVGIVVVALPFLPLLAGYLGFWLDNQEIRSLNEARQLSARLPSYMSSASESQLWFQTVSSLLGGVPPPIPNVIPTVLAVLGLIMGIGCARTRSPVVGLAGAGVLMFVLSLGPELWWNGRLTGHSLPFATAHALVPGFSSLRIVFLFAAGMILPIALLAAIAVDRLTRSPRMAGWRKHAAAAALLALFAMEFAHSPAKVGPTPDDRALQGALAESSDGAVAFVPSGAGFLTPDAFMRRMWWSLNGGRQAVISGYSGYTPRGTTYLARLVDWTDATNRRLVAEALVAFGVRSIVLDRKYLSEARTEDWQAVIQELRPAARVFDTGRFVVNHLGPDGVSSKTAWTDVEIQPVLRAALPDARIVIPVILRNRAEVSWRPPPGRRSRSGELVWSRGDGAVDSRQSFRLHVPPLVPPNSTAQAMSLVHAQTPASPGRYRLALMADGEQIAKAEVEIGAQQQAGALNSAELHVLAQPVCLRAGEAAFLQVSAVNLGPMPWDGTYRLGSRWTALDSEQNLSELEGRLFMLPWLTVPSGSGVVFEGLVKAPSVPGYYTLTFGMVQESVAWFSEREVLVQVFGPDERGTCGS